MPEHLCPGLPADWLNGWLAAIGATVLVNNLKLRWTADPVPIAALVVPDGIDVAEAIEQGLPTIEDLDASPIARFLDGSEPIGLNLTFDQFAERASMARTSSAGWSLSSFYTDVLLDRGYPSAEKGPFLPGMPGKANAPYDRLAKLIEAAEGASVPASLDGVGARDKQFGLGFDLSRIGSLADETNHWVEPVIELLAFAGLSLFPTRGDGQRVVQRGWRGRASKPGSFVWPAWSSPLDADAIDALLDVYWSGHVAAERLGVIGQWESTPYRGLGGNDPTRGFGARRISHGT